MKLCVSGLREKADIGTDEGFLAATKELVQHTKKILFAIVDVFVLFSVIFSVHGLKYIENKLFLFVPSGKISGACGWVQFPMATVLAGYIARLECPYTVSQTLRWKKRHSYHNKKG